MMLRGWLLLAVLRRPYEMPRIKLPYPLNWSLKIILFDSAFPIIFAMTLRSLEDHSASVGNWSYQEFNFESEKYP